LASNGAAGIPKIVNDVATVRARIDALGLSKTLPHGTSDAGSVFTQALAEGIDYFHANGKITMLVEPGLKISMLIVIQFVDSASVSFPAG
jgi:hypothetical protein